MNTNAKNSNKHTNHKIEENRISQIKMRSAFSRFIKKIGNHGNFNICVQLKSWFCECISYKMEWIGKYTTSWESTLCICIWMCLELWVMVSRDWILQSQRFVCVLCFNLTCIVCNFYLSRVASEQWLLFSNKMKPVMWNGGVLW